MKKYNIAVIGATGSVGGQLISILAERAFPVNNIYALASANSIGKKVSFGDEKILNVEDTRSFDFKKADIVFCCAGEDISKEFVEKAALAGCIVIDKSSLFRLDTSVPLIVPEVNGHILKQASKNIIANPNCCTIPLAVVLAPLHAAAKIKRIVVSTYQSVSGAGKDGMDELYNQTKNKYMNGETKHNIFPAQIAFNIIPQIGDIDDEGNADEEMKISLEIQKILGANIGVSVTAVRVPVFIGHSMSVNIEFDKPITVSEIEEILAEYPEISSTDNLITPTNVAGEDLVFVSRIRKDDSILNGINLWISTDNLRKGAALNAVQIAENIANS